ncbi:uncharacterized protein LOC108658168 [Drosophila navojoa]|uniref:uncharacterized protein LOC108658168 n=1 Tax=Drosophila navojoa TaxID=7232 RepID=UPI0011BD74C5|nr:uncharacterized protein LOC108658168 [Drosophila navojoa]
MTFKIIQWNINGYTNNYSELQTLIEKHTPLILSLQETHIIHPKSIPIPNNYTLITKNSSPSHGGVALLIHNSLQTREICLNGGFDVVCAELKSNLKFRVISAYIAPNRRFSMNNLQNVLETSNIPVLVTGEILDKFITQSNYILLNDGSPTHLSTHNTLTNIDITFSSPILQLDSTWYTENDLFGSDHFPIIINLFDSYPTRTQHTSSKPIFITDKANWERFSELAEEYSSQLKPSTNINKETATIQKIIISSAHKTIPQTHPTSKPYNVPWWNNNLQKLRDDKVKKWHTEKKHLYPEHHSI